jgi:sugar lactone lactonase YvrE
MSNLADLLPAGGGQNNTDFVADGTISSGAPVVLTAAGKAAPISESSVSASLGTPANFQAVGGNWASVGFDSTNNRVVAVYQATSGSKLWAAVGTVSGSSISFGTAVVLADATSQMTTQCIAFDPDEGKVVVVYRDTAAGNLGTAIVGTVSGTTISFGSEIRFANATTDYAIVVYDSNAKKMVIAYSDTANSNYGTAIVGTVSGTSMTFGSEVVFLTQTTDMITGAFDSSTNQVVLAYRDHASTLYYGKAIVGSVSGTSISFGSQTTFESATISYTSTVYDSTANKIVISYQDIGNSYYGTAVVGTVSGTAISFGTPVVFEAASTEYIGSCFNPSVNTITVIYTDGGNSSYPTYIIGTVSGTSITFGSAATVATNSYAASNSCVFDSTSNKAILGYVQPGAYTASAAVLQPSGISSNLTSTNLLGIASGAISDTATGTINTWGSRNSAQSSLTIGSDYYVQTDGRIEAGVTNIAFDISSATYTQNFDISSQATIPQAIAFNPTGTKMFIVDIAGQDVNEYALSTGFDVSSASYTQNFSVASQDTAPTGISFNAAGTKMFVCGYTNDKVYEYTLSSGFDLSTASYAQALDVSGQDTLPKDVVFNTDGTKMFVLGGIGEDVNEYTLSAYDISTASFVDSFSVASQESAPDGIAFNTDGTKMFIVGNTDSVFQYNLSSGFDVSTASYASISFSVTSQETGPTGIAFSADGKKMFIVGTQGDDVNQYATTANSFSTTYLIGQAITATQINIKDYTG